jgi:RNA-directed DNA polymerase
VRFPPPTLPVVHCTSERQAHLVLAAISQRMAEVGLTLHPSKTKIVYCRDSRRRREYDTISFTFLGYTFRPRTAQGRQGQRFTGFLPAMSRDKLIDKGRQVHQWRLDRRTNGTLADLAETINPIVRGWMNYWGHFYRSQMIPLLRRINTYLVRWARKKYKRLKGVQTPQGVVGQGRATRSQPVRAWQWTKEFLLTGR